MFIFLFDRRDFSVTPVKLMHLCFLPEAALVVNAVARCAGAVAPDGEVRPLK